MLPLAGFLLAGVDMLAQAATGEQITEIDWIGSTGAWVLGGNATLLLLIVAALGSDDEPQR